VAFNVQGTVSKDTRVQIALTNWGGLVTEVPPMNCPEGASPDNQECIFNPGKVGSRPGFKRVFTEAVGTVTFTYGKSYVDPLNVVRNLYLASDGTLYLENQPPTPIAPSNLAIVAGNYQKRINNEVTAYTATPHGLKVG